MRIFGSFGNLFESKPIDGVLSITGVWNSLEVAISLWFLRLFRFLIKRVHLFYSADLFVHGIECRHLGRSFYSILSLSEYTYLGLLFFGSDDSRTWSQLAQPVFWTWEELLSLNMLDRTVAYPGVGCDFMSRMMTVSSSSASSALLLAVISVLLLFCKVFIYFDRIRCFNLRAILILPPLLLVEFLELLMLDKVCIEVSGSHFGRFIFDFRLRLFIFGSKVAI